MTPELEIIIKKFLDYSFTEIEYDYNELTQSEKALCTEEEFRKLVGWVNGDK